MNFFIFGKLAQIPTTLAVVSECWMSAENDLQDEIRRNRPGADEETITSFFHGKFADRLRKASGEGHIENAFLADLIWSFPDVPDYELWKVANGLVADVTLHKRETEKITGGDIGLMIIRPLVAQSENFLKIGDYRRGILCQAKLKNEKGKWGRLTQNQKRVLPKRLDYLCLLLYSYTDASRRHLQNFHWYVCHEKTVEELEAYLKGDTFPYLVESDSIIQAVGEGIIGTDNNDVLDKIVSRTKNPTLVIRISWPEGYHPGSLIYVTLSHTEQKAEQINTQVSQTLLN